MVRMESWGGDSTLHTRASYGCLNLPGPKSQPYGKGPMPTHQRPKLPNAPSLHAEGTLLTESPESLSTSIVASD